MFADGLGVGQPAGIDLRRRGSTARTFASSTPISSTRRQCCSSATRSATPLRRGGRRRRAGSPIVDTALPPGDELRDLIDAGAPARWDLQRRRDEAAGDPPAVGELVMAMYETEVEALARLRSAVGSPSRT